MKEYCLRCGTLLLEAGSNDRLCRVCGWFGDKEEVLTAKPTIAGITERVVTCLNCCRTVWRTELLAEGFFARNEMTAQQLREVKLNADSVAKSMVELVINLYKKAADEH